VILHAGQVEILKSVMQFSCFYHTIVMSRTRRSFRMFVPWILVTDYFDSRFQWNVYRRSCMLEYLLISTMI